MMEGDSADSPDSGFLLSLLTEEQMSLARSSWIGPAPTPDYSYSSNHASRWIFKRVLALGWTPELFGTQDRYIAGRDSGRSEHKVERWGKKYQWMAFHELMARVADNYQILPGHDEDEDQWDAFRRLDSLRDLDPSLPPVNYLDFLNGNENAISWKASELEYLSSPFKES
jgi:hypothetical protein